MIRAILTLLLCSCGGPRFFDCPEDAITAHAVAVEHLPSAVLDRVDVSCKREESVYSGAHCVTWWYGSAVARSRWEVAYNVAGPCVLHEARHAHLWERGDSCEAHSPLCGWYDEDVERLSLFLSEVSQWQLESQTQSATRALTQSVPPSTPAPALACCESTPAASRPRVARLLALSLPS